MSSPQGDFVPTPVHTSTKVTKKQTGFTTASVFSFNLCFCHHGVWLGGWARGRGMQRDDTDASHAHKKKSEMIVLTQTVNWSGKIKGGGGKGRRQNTEYKGGDSQKVEGEDGGCAFPNGTFHEGRGWIICVRPVPLLITCKTSNCVECRAITETPLFAVESRRSGRGEED